MRSATLPMDTFGRHAIEQYAQANGTSPSAVARSAALYYLADRERGRYSWRMPRFVREVEGGPAATEQLVIDIDDATWAALEREAQSQGVPPMLLLQHAVLYFLADR